MARIDNGVPLYMQLKKALVEKIESGILVPGAPVPTEQELCSEFGISRFPVRQAMAELVAEGYLNRTRRRGTFISQQLPVALHPLSGKKILSIILPNTNGSFVGQIFAGFEKQARSRGYMTICCCSEGNADEEDRCIDKLVEYGAESIFLFPCDESRIAYRWRLLSEKGIHIGLLDRNHGIGDIDYVGSDNAGGAYSAVRYLAMRGFKNIAFVSVKSFVSSINERFEGYLKAIGDFGMNSIPNISYTRSMDMSAGPGMGAGASIGTGMGTNTGTGTGTGAGPGMGAGASIGTGMGTNTGTGTGTGTSTGTGMGSEPGLCSGNSTGSSTGMGCGTGTGANSDLYYKYRITIDELKDSIQYLKQNAPLGIFAVNDAAALQCLKILQKEELKIGREVGIVGFDNEVECEFAPVPLTSIAQNGLYLGRSAADIAADKVEGRTRQIFKAIIPTQIVVRRSCGEGMLQEPV